MRNIKNKKRRHLRAKARKREEGQLKFLLRVDVALFTVSMKRAQLSLSEFIKYIETPSPLEPWQHRIMKRLFA